MKRSRFTDEQIAFVLRPAESGAPPQEVCRKPGISARTCYRWNKNFGGMGMPELRRLKQLVELKGLVADPSLGKHILQDVLSKTL